MRFLPDSVAAWDRLVLIASSHFFDKMFAYLIGTFGLVVSLRIRLIGDADQLAQLVNGEYLFASGVLLILCGLVWKFFEVLVAWTAPEDVYNFPTLSSYVEHIRKLAFDGSFSREEFERGVRHWRDINSRQSPSMRMFIVSGLAASGLLCAFSAVSFYLSCQELLFHLWPTLWQ